MKKLFFPIILAIFFTACEKEDIETTETDEVTETSVVVFDDTDFEATDWTSETHSNDADPNFAEVFEDNAVKRIDIVVTSSRWQAMLTDMTNLYGTFGSSGGGGRPGGGGTSFSDQDPVFVPAEVFYEGKEWYRVGIRFKGNSSLSSTWSSGNIKLSFKLDFDEFEDDYPQIKNQRFYGFKKLSLKNNYNDKSFLREKVAADIFRNAGLASSHTAFYTLYVDHGDGPVYFGLYTLVEEVDDTVIDTQFANNDGNLYQPDGDGASFAAGTFTESVFVKETNEDAADWSDIQSLFTALHASTRTSDATAWRTNLEAVLDTDVFLKYLAVNTVIQNWDTYGRMTHNYFLYNNPDNNLLTWIPWDNNEALQTGNREGSLPLNFSGLSATQWPLIGYLYANSTYKAQYDTCVEEVINGVFSASTIQATYTTYAALIEPYATTETRGYSFLNNSSEFQSAVNTLKTHATQRATAVKAYLE
ncbi:MAG: CotH kinase family protein [Imperialibacter sp.]|uniref:CotH kinase family protein n=1 Tax=Imperialibacter sp. TaxID=2038411 RepID=UPI0032EE6D6F